MAGVTQWIDSSCGECDAVAVLTTASMTQSPDLNCGGCDTVTRLD